MRSAKFWPGLLAALLLVSATPAAAQLPSSQPDPLAKIREAASSNPPACSATGESLCQQVAPKIIANAQSDSPLAGNLHRLVDELSGRPAGTSVSAIAVAWAVAAFREAGVDVHTEKYISRASDSGGKSHQQENVVAEIRGREKPDEWVLLGAHLDPSTAGASASSEACNAALVVEAARDIQLTGIGPRRSIRFVLFGGEQKGMAGTWGYVRAHRNELDRARAAILFDAYSDRVNGFVLNGRHDVEAGVREALKPIESMDVTRHSFEAPFETDSFDFLIEGVPTILASATPETNGRHTGSNSFDKVDVQELKRNTAIAAVTAFGIAERAAPIGPRQSRAEIESLLKTSGLDKRMKSADLWPLWESGERGRQP
jgi:acetylornithine deacetylase/succinyl-diaminopimelate desuccinylase-like protein